MRNSGTLLPSRVLQGILAVTLLTVPGWGAPVIIGPGITGTQVGNLFTQTGSLPTCQLTATTRSTGKCTDTDFVSTVMAGTDSTFLNQNFNGKNPPQTYPVGSSALLTAIANGPLNGVNVVVSNITLPVNITITDMDLVGSLNATTAGMTIDASATYKKGSAPAGTTALPNPSQLVWTQITYDNYFAPSTKANPATLLDSYTNNGGTKGPPPADPLKDTSFNQGCTSFPPAPKGGGIVSFPPGGAGTTTYTKGKKSKTVSNAYCDPIYPFQSNNATAKNPAGTMSNFTDTPTGPWRVPASFRAIDFLSSLTTAADGTQTLTIYNNAFRYGFNLMVVPEPAYQAVLLLGFFFLVIAVRRRKQQLPH